MVIQCPECSTRFKLADEKLKPGGMKVRCSRCKEVFPVYPPGQASEPAPEPTLPQEKESPAETGAEPSDTAPSPTEETGAWSAMQQGSIQADDEDAISFRDEPPPESSAAEALDDFGFEDDKDKDSGKVADSSFDAEKEAGDFLFDEEPVAQNTAAIEEDDFAFGDETEEKETAAEEPEEDFLFDDAPAAQKTAAIAEDGFAFGEETAEEEITTEEPQEDFLFDNAPAAQRTEAIEEDGLTFGDETEEEETATEEPEEDFLFDEAPAAQKTATLAEDDFAFGEETAEKETAGESPEEDLLFGDDAAAKESMASEPLEKFAFEEESAEDFAFEEQSTDDEFGFEEEIPLETSEDSFDLDNEPEAAALNLADSEAADDFGFQGMQFGEGSDSAPALATETAVASSVAAETTTPPAAESPVHDDYQPSPPATAPKRKSSLPLVLLLLLALCGAAGYFVWQTGTENLKKVVDELMGKKPAVTTKLQIRLPLPHSFFITNQGAGQLFVVQGQAVNAYTETRSAIAVKGALHNAKGDILVQQTVFAGNPIEQEELKTLPFAKIEEKMNNQFGEALSNLNVAPGKSIPYTIVFRGLPADVTEFTIEVADSKPGGQQ